MTLKNITHEIDTEIESAVARKLQWENLARVNSRKNKISNFISVIFAAATSILFKQNASGAIMLAIGGMISISKGIEHTMNYDTKFRSAHRAARKCEKPIARLKNVRSHVGTWTKKKVLNELNSVRVDFAEIQEDFPLS
ncbi:MAG: hypothetical protein NE334_12365 [Lentisphaeraceae bacterium]|nr:hypothetical protein [Lentisphaeraceae bacterium]